MQAPAAAALLALVVLLPLPATAGPGWSTPAGAACEIQDTGACEAGGYVSRTGYTYGIAGVFDGTVTLILDGGGSTFFYTCQGSFRGGLFGSCTSFGATPPSGTPLRLSCSARGSGHVACSVTEGRMP